MNKWFFLVSIVALICSCQEPVEDNIVISGKIDAPLDDKVYLISANNDRTTLELSESGEFRDTLSDTTAIEGFYTFVHGSERASMYLTKGDNLNIQLNADQFDESLQFEGAGAVTNSFLAKDNLQNEEHVIGEDKIKEASADEVLEMYQSEKDRRLNLLNEEKGLSSLFKNDFSRSIDYDYKLDLQNYINQNYDKEEIKPIKEIVESTNFDNSEDFDQIPSYPALVLTRFYTMPEQGEQLEMYEQTSSENIKEVLQSYLMYFVNPGNEELDELYTYLSEELSGSKKEDLDSQYEKIKVLLKGNPAPEFEYLNYKGGEMALEDFKGKYVYIDVWATWCGPCRNEIPHLKEVEHDYQDKNIEFLSVSIDAPEDEQEWRDMIVDRELGGVQLLADKAWDSDIVKDYVIQGIPRFMLIGPDGMIVNASAPRPSDPKLRDLLDDML